MVHYITNDDELAVVCAVVYHGNTANFNGAFEGHRVLYLNIYYKYFIYTVASEREGRYLKLSRVEAGPASIRSVPPSKSALDGKHRSMACLCRHMHEHEFRMLHENSKTFSRKGSGFYLKKQTNISR